MTVLARFLHDARRSIAWWAVGMLALVAFTVVFYPSVKGNPTFDELFEDLPPTVRALVGAQEGIPLTSPPGYLHGRLFAAMVPVLLLTFGIALGARAISGSEEDGSLELLLANPVSRRRVLVERYVAMVALHVVVTVVLAGSLLALAPTVGLLDGVPVGRLAAVGAAVFCLALLHATLAFAVGSATGRHGPAVAVATAAAAAGYLLEGVAASADGLGALQSLSPWHWYLERNILASGVAARAIAAPLALCLALVGVAAGTFNRRDLR